MKVDIKIEESDILDDGIINLSEFCNVCGEITLRFKGKGYKFPKHHIVIFDCNKCEFVKD